MWRSLNPAATRLHKNFHRLCIYNRWVFYVCYIWVHLFYILHPFIDYWELYWLSLFISVL